MEWEYIRELQGQGIPIIHCLLRRSDKKYNFLVMEQLDHEDLEDKFQKLNRSFSMKTLLMLADQMIENIEMIHEKGVLHNDLKPDNMSMGMDAKNSSQLYIIDFGMCSRWKEADGSHIQYRGIFFYFLPVYFYLHCKPIPCNENRVFPVKFSHKENPVLVLYWPCT